MICGLNSGLAEVYASEVFANKPAALAGMQDGDRLLSVNGENVRNVEHFMTLVQTNKDAPLSIVVQRGEQKVPLTATAEMQENGQSNDRYQASTAKNGDYREPATVGEAAAFAVRANYEIIALTGTCFRPAVFRASEQ